MTASLTARVLCWPRWRLWATFTVTAVVSVELLVSAMCWLLKGEITHDYLITGLVAAGVVAPATLGLLTWLLSGAAQRAEDSLNIATGTAQMMFWEYDATADNLIFDEARISSLGVATTSAQHSLAGWLAAVHPDDQPRFHSAYQRCYALGGPDLDIEYRIAGSTNGEWVWLHTRGRFVSRNANGEPLWAVGGSINVSARHFAEAKLAEREEIYRALVTQASDGILMVDLATQSFIEFNDAACNALGYSREEFARLTITDIQAEHSSEKIAATLYAIETEGRADFETLHRHKDGTLRNVRVSNRLIKLHERQYIAAIITDITEQVLTNRTLEESERRARELATLLRLMCDNVPDMIWAKGLDRRFLFANKAVCDQLLMAHDTGEPIGKDDLFFAQRQRREYADVPNWHTFGELCQDSDAITLQKGQPSQFDEFGNVRGEFMFLDVHKAPFVNELGEVIGVVGSARNVTQQRLAEEKLRLASLVLENSSEAMMITDETERIVDVNPAFTLTTGYTRDEVIGRTPSLLHSGRQTPDFYQGMWREIEATGRWQGEIWNRRKNGEVYAEWLTINTFSHSNGSVRRRVALFSDITERKRSEELIWSQANFDVLTQLPNRRMFRDRLAQDLKKAHRAGQKLALLFLDLDRFKEVNDTLGHERGDLLLVEAARRIVTCVRASDTVARLGGDEFTIILAELDDPLAAERIAQNIIEQLRLPFVLDADVAHVSASVGITLYPSDSTDLDDLIKNADRAMYAAKSSGRSRFSYFTRAMQDAAQQRTALLSDLRAALGAGQFTLHYQPIVALDTGHITKVEALLRWMHPQRGVISPAAFIPLAEESGLIHEMGHWVFMEAARQVLRWRGVLGVEFQVSVNVSPVQMQTERSLNPWVTQLQAMGLAGSSVVIEITEGLLLDSADHVTAQLLAFRDAGIQVAIDDFGTGYSALSYLKKLDIDYVKIDQSFIKNLASDASDMALSEAIVVMAHKLGLKVIAEGVETPAQRDLLAAMGCDFAQGYLYSHPMAAEALEPLLTAQYIR